jgi:hypothetical protein
MTDELVPATPGLVAVHETERGLGETPIIGFFKVFNGSDHDYTAAVLNGAGKAVPATKIRGYKRVAWSSTSSPSAGVEVEAKGFTSVFDRFDRIFDGVFGPSTDFRRPR